MQPRKQTPSQSMLRLPAASAAVMPCAATATSDRTCSTLSPGGRLHIVFPSPALELGTSSRGSVRAAQVPDSRRGATCDESMRGAERNLASEGCLAAINEETNRW